MRDMSRDDKRSIEINVLAGGKKWFLRHKGEAVAERISPQAAGYLDLIRIPQSIRD